MRTGTLFLNEEKVVENIENVEKSVSAGVLTKPISFLLERFKDINKKRDNVTVSAIQVDELASKIAKAYEKIRKIIDWKEENLLRRSAIERIIKRGMVGKISKVIFLSKINVDVFAEDMVLQLIRGGHLPNGVLPKEIILEVKECISKYLYIVENSKIGNLNIKEKVNFFDWIMSIAACEIEDIVSPPLMELALIESMAELFNERIKILISGNLTEEEKYNQVYIATFRTLYDLDESIVAYNLLKKKIEFWRNPSDDELSYMANNIFKIRDDLNKELDHPLRKRFFNICERYDTIFTIIGDILNKYKNESEKIDEIFGDEVKLMEEVESHYMIRYKTLKRRLFKLAMISTLSVFVSNWFVLLAVEVPIANLFYGGLNYFAIAFDILVPSLVMFALVSLIKGPGKSNLNELKTLVNKYVFENKGRDIYEIKGRKKKGFLTKFFIFIFYLATFIISFGFIGWAFMKATLPPASVVLNTMMIALNVFAALIIRNRSREITVEERTTFGEFFLDIFSLPVAEIGSWLAKKWREYNIVSILFNIAIEVPVIAFIGFVENWRQFVKEKRADIH